MLDTTVYANLHSQTSATYIQINERCNKARAFGPVKRKKNTNVKEYQLLKVFLSNTLFFYRIKILISPQSQQTLSFQVKKQSVFKVASQNCFAKSQHRLFLPYAENEIIHLIGSTNENQQRRDQKRSFFTLISSSIAFEDRSLQDALGTKRKEEMRI